MLRQFCLEGTILGLKYFYIYPDRISRTFWAISLIAILYFACLLSTALNKRFLEMPTRITIENQYQSTKDLPLPAITLCSPSQISISSMKHFNRTLIDGDISLNIEEVIPQLLGFYELMPNLNEEKLTKLEALIEANRYSTAEMMSRIPQSCDEFLRVCVYRNKIYPRCRGIFKPILTRHGLCCIFNSWYYLKEQKRNEKMFNFTPVLANRTGLENSLMVITDYNPEDAVDGTILNAGSTRIMFSDWTEFPSDDEAVLVHPNLEVFHLIYGTYTYCSDEVATLPVDSRNCYFKDEHHLQFFREYHNSDCDNLCYVKAVWNRCHCYMFYVPYLWPDTSCDATKIPCILQVKRDMKSWLHSPDCQCPRDCESRHYKVESVNGNLKALENMVDRYLMTGIQMNISSTIHYFFFPRDVYVKQKQETVMSLISFASNLGGVFGLCLGCSLFSLLEAWFYLYRALTTCIRNRFRAWRRRVAD